MLHSLFFPSITKVSQTLWTTHSKIMCLTWCMNLTVIFFFLVNFIRFAKVM